MKGIVGAFLLLMVLHDATAQTIVPGLDASFGNGGIVLDSFASSGFKYAYDIKLQPDGKIIAVGNTLSRYLANGSLETTFGNNGNAYPIGICSRILLQNDGKIVAIGENGFGPFVMRFKTNGVVDSSFGTNGLINVCCIGGSVAALQPDGKILVSGIVNYSINIWRVTADGKTDSTFGANGIVLTHNGNYQGDVDGISVMGDGRIVIGGIGYNSQVFRSVMVMRFMPDGSFDTSLGHTGKIYPIIEDYCRDMKLQGDGKILLPIGGLGADAAILRLKADGSIDSTFGQNGFADVPDMRIFSMQIRPDGKLVVGGDNWDDFVVARVKANGVSMDSTFGKNGRITTNIGDEFDRIAAIDLQQDGKIIAAGRSEINNTSAATRLTLVRYLPDAPSATPSFLTPSWSIHMYPNPATVTLNIDAELPLPEKCVFRILNFQGQTVFTGSSDKSHTVVNIGGLPAGIYLAEISLNGAVQTHLFTKE